MGIKRGDNFALSRLGYLYESGQAVVQDFRRAKDLYELGIAKGSTAAYYDLGRLYQHGLGVARDYEKARELFQQAMQKGNADAPTNLGILYEFGQGVAKDLRRARELYEIGIERGNGAAPAALGNMYYHGRGVARDFQKVRELFELSMQRGWRRAATSLGVLYENGHGAAQDFQKAKELYELGIKSGYDLAPELLGNMYRDGRGVYKDWNKATELYEMSIDRGSAEAATGLGYMYQQLAHDLNKPGAQSPSMQEHYEGKALRKAKEMYELAIARGSTSALWYLALLYKNDLSSDELACQWMAKAKEAGEREAADKLEIIPISLDDMDNRIREVFTMFDKDGSGQLDMVELRDAPCPRGQRAKHGSHDIVPTIVMAIFAEESVEREDLPKQILDSWVPRILDRRPDVAAILPN
ncbi:esiB [Symbiodinium sp. CCMP2592]|nr:esiB [Symbiodinium sp. CCMP2592]